MGVSVLGGGFGLGSGASTDASWQPWFSIFLRVDGRFQAWYISTCHIECEVTECSSGGRAHGSGP